MGKSFHGFIQFNLNSMVIDLNRTNKSKKAKNRHECKEHIKINKACSAKTEGKTTNTAKSGIYARDTGGRRGRRRNRSRRKKRIY